MSYGWCVILLKVPYARYFLDPCLIGLIYGKVPYVRYIFVWWVCHLSFQSAGTSFPNNFVLSVNWNLLPSCCFSKVSRMYNRCVYVRLCMYVLKLSCVSSVRVFLVGFVGIECGLLRCVYLVVVIYLFVFCNS